jgi:glutamate-1-semialdehyde 2,1-aminomutase
MDRGKRTSEIEKYAASTPLSKKLQSEAEKYLPGGSSRGTAYFAPYPFFVERTDGHHITDVDGNRYLDFMLNATTYVLGHANEQVVGAVQKQASNGISYSTPHESQVQLAKMLCERVPSVEKVRFTNSGTEGTLNAIRAARAYTGKHKIAKIEGGYHGNHEYVSVSVYTPLDKLDPVEPTAVAEWPGQPPSVVEDVIALHYNDIESTERILREHADDVSCVIMEPVLSNFGYLPAEKKYLQKMRDLTNELGMVLIFDEVQSFRLASGGAQEHFGVIPDMTTFGKVIGGGMPVGSWGGRTDLMDLFDPTEGPIVSHAGTFNANPMTMVAGLATLAQMTPEVYERMNALGDVLRAKLRAVFDELDVEAQVTGIGSLFGIHFTGEEITNYRSVLRGDQAMQKKLFTGLLNEGILMQTKAAGCLSALTTEAEVDELVDATRRVMLRLR